MTKNIMIVGVGGQGSLLASKLLGRLLVDEGYDVKVSEVHGMSQRGGSVSSEVRFGKQVFSPMVPEGESDYLVVLDETQVEVNRYKLRDGGVLIAPADVPVDQLANKKALNILLLGALSRHFDFPEEQWLAHIHRHLPAKLHADNDAAFRLGRA